MSDQRSTAGEGDRQSTDRLDVRDVEGPPFPEITDALGELAAGDRLTLVNSFEPEPLYSVLEARGFTYETRQVSADEWHVEIERDE